MTWEKKEALRSSSYPPASGGPENVFPPRAVRTSETVINLERRAASSSSVELPAPSSTLCNALFPNPDVLQQQTIPNPAGIELGHFRVQTAIRSGGMGAVFEALDTRLNRNVALKILPPGLSRDLSSVQRFQNEAQAAAQLDHDNIARVYFIGEDKGLHFIAFEFIRGTNLREVVQQRGRLTPAEAVNYTLQVASAVAHASAHGVVHRDIKPSNIIITPSGRAKLVDLGLARSEHRENEPDLTLAGTTLGTFDYISPEQAKDPRAVDVRSDIYSLGCTLYHLLTGEPPYPQGTVLQKLLDHQGKDAPDPRIKNRKVSADLAAIVKMMMASDPRRRYQTAEILIRDLLVIANSLGLRGVSSEGLMWLAAQRTSDTFWERNASWLATAAGLLLIVGYLQFGLNGTVKENKNPFGEGTANTDNPQPQSTKPSSKNGIAQSKPATSPGMGSSDIDEEWSPEDIATDSKTVASAEKTNNSSANADADDGNTESKTERTLTDPSQFFPNGYDQNSFTLHPLVSGTPQGAVIGPQASRPERQIASRGNSTPSESTTPKGPSETATAVENGAQTSANSTEVATNSTENPNRTAIESNAPIVVLKSDGLPGQPFPTLEAACAGAQDGNVIELRFNGPRTESPLKIRNKITIRAARNFRPVIEFVPKEIPAAGYETRMITITSGALDLVDVNLQLDVKASIATDFWALISTQRADAIRLQRVMVTVQNPSHRPATVVEFRPGASRMVTDMEMMNTGQMSSAMTVLVKDSMVRGGADLLLVRSILSARVDLDNCLLALDGTVLRAQGAIDVPEKPTELALRLNQLTAALNSGLIVLEGGDAPRKLGRISIEATNNIFTRDTSPEHQAPPFVSMISSEPPEDLMRMLAWNGQKNFYDGFETYLSRSTTDGSKTATWNYEDWKFRWDSHEVDPHSTIVLWKKRWSDKPFIELNPTDFALDESATGNPALSAANDGGNAGVDLSRLIKLNAVTATALPPDNRIGTN